MAFTRFHDDPCRIQKKLVEQKFQENYQINVPGNGVKPCYMEDPFIRLQKWGGNLRTNTINLENSLLGIDNKLSRDCIQKITPLPKSKSVEYPTCDVETQQPRATHPAWTARELQHDNFQTLFLNPQENVCLPFQNNLNTRLIERDNFKAKAPCVIDYKNEPIDSTIFGGLVKKDESCVKNGNCGLI